MTTNEKVLELVHDAFQLSRKITQPVDPHKRYHAGDKDDPHTQLIDFVYETGAALFRGGEA
jgi:hypothetical protein